MARIKKLCGLVFWAILLPTSSVAVEGKLKVIDDPAYTHAQRLVEVEPGRAQSLARRLADQLAALSKRGVIRPVPDSTHEIQKSQPQAVIDAILDVLKDVRDPSEQQSRPVPSP
jgi:hypothetical protein